MLRALALGVLLLPVLGGVSYGACDLEKEGEEINRLVLSSKSMTEQDMVSIMSAMEGVGRLIEDKKFAEACAATLRVKAMVPK